MTPHLPIAMRRLSLQLAALLAGSLSLAACNTSASRDDELPDVAEARTDTQTAEPASELPRQVVCPASDEAAAPAIAWSRYGKLTLPTDRDGRRGPDEVPAFMVDDYASDFFYRAKPGQVTAGGYRASGGESVFWAPVDGGATTKNAKYVRSEFREQIVPGNDRANWPLTGTHVMRGTVRVSLLPTPLKAGDNVKTVIAQIHGVESAPPIKLQVASARGNTVIYGIYNDTPVPSGGSSSRKLPIALCEPISYEIRVADGVLTTTVNGQQIDQRDLKPAWSADTFYFKAGNYVQNSTKNAEGAAEVIYTAVMTEHRP